MRRPNTALLLATALAVSSGCKREEPSGLSGHQVDQILEVQQQVQAERSELSRQRDQLEEDRRHWFTQARRDPIIAESIRISGLLITCCLPLLLVALLAWTRGQDAEAETTCELLIEDLTSESPKLSSREPQRIEESRP